MPEDLDALKTEISREWLGRGGVVAVGVGEEDGHGVVVVSLDRDRPTARTIAERYAGRPVVVHSGEGEIRPF
ncbi:hypothetical protein ACFZA1_14715 [Streptomyces filipinensis]|uniref:hypothetical protein n=1 Tax=Streptomyces filipinensis TaxID=66887 RepID=UPI0036E1EB83